MVVWMVSLIPFKESAGTWHFIGRGVVWDSRGLCGLCVWVSKVEIGWQETMDYIDLLVPHC